MEWLRSVNITQFPDPRLWKRVAPRVGGVSSKAEETYCWTAKTCRNSATSNVTQWKYYQMLLLVRWPVAMGWLAVTP